MSPGDHANHDPARPGAGTRVCVTGASGYVGSHVVRALLGRGYRVRASVRDPADAAKTDHLRALAAGRPEGDLELVAADLLEPGSYDAVVAGCPLVCHVAASVRLRARDPQREIVDPAVQGTKNVLGAVRKAGGVRRVVLTSSIAAVLEDTLPRDHVYTEQDWNDSVTLKDPYPLAKARAERAAWAFQEALPEEERFELVTLNPVFVFGPVLARIHGRGSPDLLRSLMKRDLPACPRLSMGVVDVRDVALAHALALEIPAAAGRYILHNENIWMQDAARTMARHFPDHPIPTRRLPNLAMYAAALFDKRLSFGWVRKNLGREYLIDAGKAARELGLTYRPLEQTLLETCRSFLELGVV